MPDNPPKPSSSMPPAAWFLDDGGSHIVKNIMEERRRRGFGAMMTPAQLNTPLPLRISSAEAEAAAAAENAAAEAAASPKPSRGLKVEPPDLGTPVLMEIRACTKVGRAVVQNIHSIELAGWLFLTEIDKRLEALGDERRNDDDAHQQIAELEGLKQRVEAFLNAASQFVTNKGEEQAVVKAKYSFNDGLRDIWEKRHLEIANVSLFGLAALICQLVDPLSVIVAGTLVGPKNMAEVITAFFKQGH